MEPSEACDLFSLAGGILSRVEGEEQRIFLDAIIRHRHATAREQDERI